MDIRGLARTAVAYEIGMYRSIARWVARRPSVPGEGAEPFGYVGIVLFAIWVFIILSAIEIPIAHLLIPWDALRIAVLILGAWGLTWMLGYLAGMRVYPHVVNDAEIRIRYGATLELVIPWFEVASIQSRSRSVVEDRGVQFTPTGSGTIQSIVMSNQTNVEVVLRAPRRVPRRGGVVEEVVEVRFWADDPTALVASARRRLATGAVPE